MKKLIFLAILSIFFGSNICTAQTDMQLCGALSGEITLQQLQNITVENCNAVNLVDAAGNIFILKSYTFSFSPANGNTPAYFEQAEAGYITNTIKNKLKEAIPGDRFHFTNFNFLDKGVRKKKNILYTYTVR